MPTPAATAHPRRPDADRDVGSATVETVVATPLLVMLLLFLVLCGRLVSAQLDVDAAAHAAARAASLARTVAGANADARRVAAETLTTHQQTCTSPTVTVEADGLRPGGVVRVTVTCQVPLGDLALIGVPGSRTVTSTASSPIDVHRSRTLGFSNPDATTSAAAMNAGRP